jgi:hypothetical protein
MSGTLIDIAQWLIPSGGLGAALAWFFSKTLRQIRTTREVHDTYKQLYENIQETLVDLQDENKKLYRAVSKLERAISKASSCRYYADCPIGRELLREREADTKPSRRKRQPGAAGDPDGAVRADPGIESAAGDSG